MRRSPRPSATTGASAEAFAAASLGFGRGAAIAVQKYSLAVLIQYSTTGGNMYPGTYAASTPDKPAMIMGATGQTVTFAELDAGANRLAQLFAALGFETGDHI